MLARCELLQLLSAADRSAHSCSLEMGHSQDSAFRVPEYTPESLGQTSDATDPFDCTYEGLGSKRTSAAGISVQSSALIETEHRKRSLTDLAGHGSIASSNTVAVQSDAERAANDARPSDVRQDFVALLTAMALTIVVLAIPLIIAAVPEAASTTQAFRLCHAGSSS